MTARPPLPRLLRRVAVTVAGGVVVAAGVAMLVLPGPGLVTIALGLSLLGREHAWAASWEQAARARIAAAARRVRGRRPVAAPTPLRRRNAADERVDRAA